MEKMMRVGKARRSVVRLAVLIILVTLFGSAVINTLAVTKSNLDGAGYLDFSYGDVVTPWPTGEKPESKLWWNDGIWWGILWNPSANTYRIYQLDWEDQVWVDTGVGVDDRPISKADALWDTANNKLYIVSHFDTEFSRKIADPEMGALISLQLQSGHANLFSGFWISSYYKQ